MGQTQLIQKQDSKRKAQEKPRNLNPACINPKNIPANLLKPKYELNYYN